MPFPLKDAAGADGVPGRKTGRLANAEMSMVYSKYHGKK